jgi:hypothetical protein
MQIIVGEVGSHGVGSREAARMGSREDEGHLGGEGMQIIVGEVLGVTAEDERTRRRVGRREGHSHLPHTSGSGQADKRNSGGGKGYDRVLDGTRGEGWGPMVCSCIAVRTSKRERRAASRSVGRLVAAMRATCFEASKPSKWRNSTCHVIAGQEIGTRQWG